MPKPIVIKTLETSDNTQIIYPRTSINALYDANGAAVTPATLDSTGKVPSAQLPEISSVRLFTGTLTAGGWVAQDDGSSQQTVAISGVTADMNGTVDHDTTQAAAANYDLYVQEETEYLDLITNGYSETVAGGIKFVIFGDVPTVDIPIVAQLARG